MVIKWIDKNMKWFFMNGNKTGTVKAEHRPAYTIEDDGEFVNIRMNKHTFIHVTRFMKYGLDCYRYESLPRWEPKMSTSRKVAKTVDSMNYEAYRIAQELFSK